LSRDAQSISHRRDGSGEANSSALCMKTEK
jgi:hypothetical protein